MSEFGGYVPYGTEPLKLTLCLEEGSILFNKAVLDTLDHPKQVQMLINEDRQMLLVQACTVDDREAIVSEIRRLIPKLKENGGYIFSSDHSIPNSVSLENMKAIVEAVKEEGTY